MDLRCPNGIKFADLVDPGVVEFKCRSDRCGAGGGTVVLHRFNAITGEFIETLRFADPGNRKERASGAQHSTTAIWSA
jgi:hypothetical protein